VQPVCNPASLAKLQASLDQAIVEGRWDVVPIIRERIKQIEAATTAPEKPRLKAVR
jgi:hypothetical protein